MCDELMAFLAGVLCAGFPLLIFYLHERDARMYFERERNSLRTYADNLELAFRRRGKRR